MCWVFFSNRIYTPDLLQHNTPLATDLRIYGRSVDPFWRRVRKKDRYVSFHISWKSFFTIFTKFNVLYFFQIALKYTPDISAHLTYHRAALWRSVGGPFWRKVREKRPYNYSFHISSGGFLTILMKFHVLSHYLNCIEVHSGSLGSFNVSSSRTLEVARLFLEIGPGKRTLVFRFNYFKTFSCEFGKCLMCWTFF